MLAARGVSLGLGKINLSDLHNLPDRATIGRTRKSKDVPTKPKLRVRKHVDKKTLWAACRAVAFGSTIIVLGMIMAVVGYFDKDLSVYEEYDAVLQKNVTKVNDLFRIQLKSMQYIGPVVMGIGSFLLIIACVITLESRDRHAQVIQDENMEYRRMSERLVTSSNTKSSLVNDTTPAQAEGKPFAPAEEEEKDRPNGGSNGSAFGKSRPVPQRPGESSPLGNNSESGASHLLKSNGQQTENPTNIDDRDRSQTDYMRETTTVAEIHVPRRTRSSPKTVPNGRVNRLSKNPSGAAPMAEMDSLLDANLSSSSSSLFLINDPFAV